MTAGRVSSTSMTMTTTMPKEFSSHVIFITTGKFTDSGVVLKRLCLGQKSSVKSHVAQLHTSPSQKLA